MGRKKYQIDFALKFWRLTHLAKRMGHVTPFRQLAGLVASQKAFSGSFVPVREDVDIPPGVVAPRQVLIDYVKRASHRTILHECPCRAGEGCPMHLEDLGCILLGEGGKDVDPTVGRPATVADCLRHIERALSAGLLPMVGHMRIDKIAFGIRDFSRFITMCFCCECCCVLRSNMKKLTGVYPRSIVRLDGVKVEVKEGCVGCSECLSVCPVENISLVGGKAVVGPACLGCGACVDACQRGFIEMTIESCSRFEEEMKRRIEAGVKID